MGQENLYVLKRLTYALGLWFAWTCGHACGFERATRRAEKLIRRART